MPIEHPNDHPKKNESFLHQHPIVARAHVSIVRTSTELSISCDWPLDLSTDEWFTYKIVVSPDILDEARRNYIEQGTALIRGTSGEVEFQRTSSSQPKATVDLRRFEGSPRSLWLTRVEGLHEFLQKKA